MNDHNLDDLIIDDVEPQQNQKAKSFLTIIALAIVVLIVAIIFTKIMLKTSNQDQLTFEQDQTEMISPDLTLQSAPEPAEEISEPPQPLKEEPVVETPKEEVVVEKSTEQAPIIVEESTTVITPEEPETTEPAPEKTETVPEKTESKSMVQKVSESVQKLVEEPVKEEPLPTPAPMPEPIEEKPSELLEVVEVPKAEATKVTTQKVESSELKREVKKTPEAIIEHAVQRPRPRPVNIITRPGSKPANVITRPETSTPEKGTYYIQVGAFETSPSQRFLERIKRSGFNYIITKRSRSGLKKLLIGPYQNRTSAENALLDVKDRINKKAFLHKKK